MAAQVPQLKTLQGGVDAKGFELFGKSGFTSAMSGPLERGGATPPGRPRLPAPGPGQAVAEIAAILRPFQNFSIFFQGGHVPENLGHRQARGRGDLGHRQLGPSSCALMAFTARRCSFIRIVEAAICSFRAALSCFRAVLSAAVSIGASDISKPHSRKSPFIKGNLGGQELIKSPRAPL